MFGVFDTEYIDLPDVLDQDYLTNLTLASGTTFETAITEIEARMAAFNAGFDSLVGALAFETQEEFIEYADAVAFKVSPKGEYTIARPQRGEEMGGHMLPVRAWDAGVGWTEDGLREIRLANLLRNFDGLLLGFKVHFKKEVLRRLFRTTEVPVEWGKTTAVSPGFAGSGTGGNAYTRPYPSGAALPGGYTHYIRSDTAGLDAAMLAARDKLFKQGHPAPYDLIAPQSVIDTIAASNFFVPTGSPLIRSAPADAEALVDPTLYVGVFGNLVRVRVAVDDWSDSALAIFKTYGNLDPRNALAIRFPNTAGVPGNGRAAYVRSRALYPLANAEVVSRWGVGVASRVAAVLISIAPSGPYTPPTI